MLRELTTLFMDGKGVLDYCDHSLFCILEMYVNSLCSGEPKTFFFLVYKLNKPEIHKKSIRIFGALRCFVHHHPQ